MFRSTRLPRTAAAVGFAAAAAIALAACSSPASSSSDGSGSDTVGMAIQPWLGYGPWYIAQEEGYFADQGVDVTITNFSNDADMSAAFASHRVQIANVASHSALQLKEQGLDISIVLLLDASLTADAILSDGAVSSVADLKGQRIAFEEGSVSNLLLGYALQQSGLSLSDITPVPMDPSEAATALIGGSVPVAVTYEPYISEAQQASGDLERIFTAGEKPGLISDVLIVDNSYLKENPEAVQKVVNAWGPAVAFYESNPDEARSIIATNVGSDVEALATAFDGVEFFPLDDNKTRLGGDYATSVLPAVQDVATEIGLLEGGTDTAEMIDSSFVENAP